jgi:hypothetical protein
MSRKLSILWVAATLALGATVAGLAEEPSSQPADTKAAAGKPLQEVTITGQREALTPRVTKFVGQISGSYYAEGLARWLDPVCPLVSGLPGPDGDFILGRVSDTARAAGVPLAGEKCRPNLYILVTNQPKELLREMDKRNRIFTFGNAAPTLIDAFIESPRAVRVWYHTTEKAPEGTPLAAFSFPSIESAPSGREGSSLIDDTQTGSAGIKANGWSQATHLSYNVVWDIYRAFVVVDTTQLKGASRGQIADYVALIALAELKTQTTIGDAPTILTLFDEAPQAAPAGMSSWDQSFLKALYTVEQKSKMQRDLIAREMVREIVPR